MRMNNAREYINYLQDAHMDFLLTSSNYTTQIEYEGAKEKYVQTMQSPRTFACFAKLKSQIKDKPIPDVDKDSLIYFHHDFKKDIYIDTVYNIDLKSAYATILYNDKYINKETFDYIVSSTKQERLASVGMLASRKKIFNFKGGSPIDEKEVVSEKSGLFFYAVKRTYEIMSNLKKICGTDYLYTWVDGIYLLPNDAHKKECIAYLEENNFKCSFDVLSEFEVKIKGDHTLVTFKKEGQRKLFNLPSPMSEFKKIMMDAILAKKATKHKNGFDQNYKAKFFNEKGERKDAKLKKYRRRTG